MGFYEKKEGEGLRKLGGVFFWKGGGFMEK